MKKIVFSEHVLPHAVAVATFLIITLIFFKPVFFENKVLDQQDIQQHMGSSKALRDYREATGQEGLWSNSMFSGMPAYLVNVIWSDGVVVTMKKVISVFLPHPVNNIFIAFLCYYIMMLAFGVRPYLAIAGSIAFGLSSYLIIGLSVGHNARIGAIAFMPLVMAGIHLVFTSRRILGFGVTASGLALHLRENHLQITYYLMLIVAGYGLVQLILAVREKQMKGFIHSIVILIPAVAIAAATFFGQFWAITEYTRFSIRGPSELSRPASADGSEGLTKEYAFAYNYGIWEPMTLLIPEIYGGTSMKAFVQDQSSESFKALAQSPDEKLANQLVRYTSAYWGPQNGTIGPYYAGAIIVFLFVIGIMFADRKYVWWLATLSMLSIFLSWGSAFPSFNYFMFDYFPGYNKFRSVNFALVIVLFALPLLGALGLEQLFVKGINKVTRKSLLVAFACSGGVCLTLLLFAGVGSFTRAGEEQLPVWFLSALRSDRISLMRSDSFRSLAFVFAVFIVLYLDLPRKVSFLAFCAFLTLLVTIDIATVDKRYFTKDNFKGKRGNVFFEMTGADQEILKDKGYYRVYNLQSPFEEAVTSYYHHSIGGYHGAKLRRYQELYDSAIVADTRHFVADIQSGSEDFRKYGVLNMLNTRYIKYGNEANAVIRNPAANGPAWFVKEVVQVGSPIEELRKVREINTHDVAVIDNSKFKIQPRDSGGAKFDSVSQINLVEMKPPYMKYESSSSVNSLAVFSEIYYPKGWNASIDGKEVTILRADYVLRALEVPAGKHTIEFRFEPKPYGVGNTVSMASSWLLLLIVLGCLGWNFKKSD